MNFVTALLYPVALLLPAAGVVESDSAKDDRAVQEGVSDEAARTGLWPQISVPDAAPEWPFLPGVMSDVTPRPGWQVHIEQRVQIRITPRSAMPVRPEMFVGIPGEDVSLHLSERKIGKCLSVLGIAGVQPDRGNRLLLYMRDRRLIAADLERSCRARDFYSGFYIARTGDGQICVDRDTLLSRSGMNCKLTRLRQLVEDEH